MPVFTELLPATKSSKHNGINWEPMVAGQGLLTILAGKKDTQYHVQPLHTSWGRGFVLAKLDGSERYSVLCATPGSGEHDRCDCAGFSYRPNQPCRHIAACKAIVENEFLWSDRSEPKPVEEPVAKKPVPKYAPSPRDTADQGAF